MVATTCKTIYSWILPVLYSSVVLTTPHQVIAFRCTVLCGRSEDTPRLAPVVNRTYVSYVQNLWLGPTSSTCCLIHPDEETNVAEDTQLEDPQAMTVWASVIKFVDHCTSLHTLAIIDCPGSVVQILLSLLPSTLDSLYIFLQDNPATYQLEIYPVIIAHIASIRRIIFVHTSLTDMTMLLLSRIISITRICALAPRRSSTRFPGWIHARNVADHLFHLARSKPDPNILPTTFIYVENCDLRSDDSAIYHLDVICPFSVAWLNKRGMTLSVVDGRDESGRLDSVETVFTIWLATLHSVGCVKPPNPHVCCSEPSQSQVY